MEKVMRGPGAPTSLLFRLVVPATAVFIITILSLIAVLFSDERAPLARLLDRYGNALLLSELFVVLVLSILAMTMDRLNTLRAMRTDKHIDLGAQLSESPGSVPSLSPDDSKLSSGSTGRLTSDNLPGSESKTETSRP